MGTGTGTGTGRLRRAARAPGGPSGPDCGIHAIVNKRGETASIPSHVGSDEEDDRTLVDRAQAGDHDAFRGLFERYHRRAYGLALGVVKNPDDALDVVQDAFIKAHRHLGKFEGTSSFYTWLYRIVMNLAIDHLRRGRRIKNVDWEDAGDQKQAEAAAGDDGLLPKILDENPGKVLIRKEMREHIADALSGLSDNHRSVLVMRELEGLSYEEMAQAMKCSKGTIMSRLFHARKNMQRRLVELMGGKKDLEA
jgi:RNA polymerase sigma-70 factor, ECF subfamily